jgi:23S rRNA pseudouridine1911/1915/1917 synthase
MSNIEISQAERLDQYVARQLPTVSRAYAAKLVETGMVTVNDAINTKSGYKVRAADTIVIDHDPEQMAQLPEIALEIIYEDDDCVVINKPAGLLSHSKGTFNPEATVASWLASHVTGLTGERAGVVHRLDRATSGVMICAKTPSASAWLQKQFSQRRVKKIYEAVVKGVFETEHAVIDMPIERNPKKPQTFRVGSNGKSAVTEYKVLAHNDTYSLVELSPLTGRTHQLRVHLENLDHPILGDSFYGGPEADRLYLHAKSLEITIPSRERKVFIVPVPESFRAMVRV